MARGSGQPWTEDEVEHLKALAGKMTVSEIAKALNRTIGAVTVAANTLQLSLRVSDTSKDNASKDSATG